MPQAGQSQEAKHAVKKKSVLLDWTAIWWGNFGIYSVGIKEPVAALCFAQMGQKWNSALKPWFSDFHLNWNQQMFVKSRPRFSDCQSVFHYCNKCLCSPNTEQGFQLRLKFCFWLLWAGVIHQTQVLLLTTMAGKGQKDDQEVRGNEIRVEMGSHDVLHVPSDLKTFLLGTPFTTFQ